MLGNFVKNLNHACTFPFIDHPQQEKPIAMIYANLYMIDWELSFICVNLPMQADPSRNLHSLMIGSEEEILAMDQLEQMPKA